jgi:hypothetical protein
MTRKPYVDRSDLDKLASCWNKTLGFFNREEWSAAIIRAATAAEIATNIAVRSELEQERKLEKVFVDSLLKWANGLDGKLSRLLLPLPVTKESTLNKLHKKTKGINKKRNEVAHSGNFMNEVEAIEVLNTSREFIDKLVGLYHPNYSVSSAADQLNNFETNKYSAKI